MTANTELADFIHFYLARHQSREWSVLVTCACGWFHTYTKEAERLMAECVKQGYIRKTKGTFTITI